MVPHSTCSEQPFLFLASQPERHYWRKTCGIKENHQVVTIWLPLQQHALFLCIAIDKNSRINTISRVLQKVGNTRCCGGAVPVVHPLRSGNSPVSLLPELCLA